MAANADRAREPRQQAAGGANEPDDTPLGQDCVDAVSATQIATDRCGNKQAAVCECEP